MTSARSRLHLACARSARRHGLRRHARVPHDQLVLGLRDDVHVSQHPARERRAIPGHDLVAVLLQVALRMRRTARLDLTDDVVVGVADAQPVLPPRDLDRKLVQLLGLGRAGAWAGVYKPTGIVYGYRVQDSKSR